MAVYEVRIEPLDPLLFGDNRSARAGFDHLLRDQDPSPLTLHGAIGRYLQRCNGGTWPGELLGEWQSDVLAPRRRIAELRGFCLHGPGGGRFFPCPRHLRCTFREGLRDAKPRPADLLVPREQDRSRSSSPWPRLLLSEEAEPLADEIEEELVLSESGLADVLCGEMPAEAGLPAALFRSEPRPGMAMDNDAGTAIEGRFFTRPYRRFQPAVGGPGAAPAGLTAWLETLATVKLDLSDGVGFLGGDRRRARFAIGRCEEPLESLREQVAEAAGESPSRGFLLALLTPAVETGAAVVAAGMPAVAAALGRPVYGSGWDVEAGQPREIRSLVPAGSVYFFDWPADAPPGPARAGLIRRLWLCPLHSRGAAVGFGRCLPGIWR
jgi:CRISPR type III-B/RAMP module-associated protein Cmr3